ncbi:aspartyl-phosphate phosphatase Spo0E family protein [Paenibacillus xylanilyticus]|uniref:Aspartyl-phosphate phosphatase Spo0E family protein n=1 Tax=Paenibacillus xylanilyticus TaxID=248903 RepID=A0A7Y6BWA7_9BACL|nr:aspartyl-phosphate phosphatase Spo0E family protein [Paenibacillus xylanilyticus]NUU76168.1 aspartyl-phosphate phosphatase Spo0E family protein [Paenibacillus xylanilyticus]
MKEVEWHKEHIELNRQELRRLVQNHGMQHHKVLLQSRILDELINNHYKMNAVSKCETL